MRSLLSQVDTARTTRLYFLSLMAALTIPDIAGAMDADDGRATGERYASWFESWVRPRLTEAVENAGGGRVENPLTGQDCYRFRCSLLHQGTTQHPRSQFERNIFIEPGATLGRIHYMRMSGALCIDVPTFCGEVTNGARLWLDAVEETELYRKNYAAFASRHGNGLMPYMFGVPVVG
jgi:hypothetical protein